MFTLVFVTVVCGSMSVASAITCSECMEMSSSNTGVNDVLAGVTTSSCVESGGQTKDCTNLGNGCMRMDLTYYYTSDSIGDLEVSFNMQSCGAAQTTCLDDNTLQQQGELSRQQIDAAMADSGVTFNRLDGNVCTCNTGDLCNQVAQAKKGDASNLVTNVGLMLAALFSALAFKAV